MLCRIIRLLDRLLFGEYDNTQFHSTHVHKPLPKENS